MKGRSILNRGKIGSFVDVKLGSRQSGKIEVARKRQELEGKLKGKRKK